jgi:nuclease YhcG-like protein
MGRQQRITLDGEHFFIDLVFYNRLTRSFILLDLKVGKLTHQDLGQMQMYVNYYQRELTAPDENPPIGIVCQRALKTSQRGALENQPF